MGNLYGSGRSNYFAVRDEAHFLKWAEALGVEVNENSDTHTIGKTFAMIALNDDGGFPDAYASGEFDAEDADEETAEVVERDILMELSYMLHPQTPFVWMQTAEKLQYLVGVAFAVAPADETNPYAERSHLRTVSIDRIYDLCKEICQYEPTKCEYYRYASTRKGKHMGQVTRPVTGKEVLKLFDCPCCDGEISVGDRGYSTFNHGWAECKQCKRKWSWSCVNDAWDVGQKWNVAAKTIKHNLDVLSWIGVKVHPSIISQDFAAEKLQDEAAVLLTEFKETVIGADRPKVC